MQKQLSITEMIIVAIVIVIKAVTLKDNKKSMKTYCNNNKRKMRWREY